MADKPQETADTADTPQNTDETPQFKTDTLQYMFRVDTNPFWALINQYFRRDWSVPTKIVAAVTEVEDPVVALARLWEAFFIAVGTIGDHATHLYLLAELLKQPSTPSSKCWSSEGVKKLSEYPPNDGSLDWSSLPVIDKTWQRMEGAFISRRHSIALPKGKLLEAASALAMFQGREERGVTEYFFFVRVSAYWLRWSFHNPWPRFCHPVNILYACKAGLERKPPDDPSEYRLWSIDVLIATQWLQGAGLVLWEAGDAGIRKDYPEALAADTPLWQGQDAALTPTRWALWVKQLKVAYVSQMCPSTREHITRAYRELEHWLRT